jgi:hypothetical protein
MIMIGFVVHLELMSVKSNTIKDVKTIAKDIKKPMFLKFNGYMVKVLAKNI